MKISKVLLFAVSLLLSSNCYCGRGKNDFVGKRNGRPNFFDAHRVQRRKRTKLVPRAQQERLEERRRNLNACGLAALYLKDSRNVRLIEAVEDNDLEMVKKLLENGADANACKTKLYENHRIISVTSALEMAIHRLNVPVIKSLMSAGAILNSPLKKSVVLAMNFHKSIDTKELKKIIQYCFDKGLIVDLKNKSN